MTKAGGKVLGEVKAPINTNDFSSFLLQAQSSKAQVIESRNAGGDTINSIKQAAEFGIVKGGQKLAGLLVFISDIHSLGLERAQGLSLTEAFYWDLNDKTRAFPSASPRSSRARCRPWCRPDLFGHPCLPERRQGGRHRQPRQGDGHDEGQAVDDPVFGKSYIRADGRNMHDMYLFEVKKPSESKGPWDYYNLIATIPAEEAFRPLDQGNCPMVAKKN